MLRLSALLLLAALALGACAGPAAPSLPPAPGATSAPSSESGAEPVTIGFAAQEYERPIYEPLIERFEQENPGIRIQFVPIDDLMREVAPEDFSTQINRRIAASADTAMPFFIQAEDIAAGTFADLKPLIDADPTFDPDDFHPGALETYTVDGGVYAIPRTLTVALLSYNRDLFAAHGVGEPPLDVTWSELLALAEQFGSRRGSEIETYGYADWSNGLFPLLGLLDESGVNLFAAGASGLRLDDPRVEEALARIAALGESGALNLPQQNGTGNAGDFGQLIGEGRVAMWPADAFYLGPDGSSPAFEIGAAPLPQTALPLFGTGQGYVMSGGTQHQQEAWRWLSFLSRQDTSGGARPAGAGQVPARRSLADQSGYWAQLDEGTAAAVRAALERQVRLPSLGAFDGRVFQALSEALAATAGGAPASEALREAQASLDEQLAAAEATPSPEPDRGPLVVTLPEEPVAPEGATQVTFSVAGMDPGEVRRLAREFNRERPELFVNVQSATGMDGPISFTSMAAAADCFIWYGPPSSDEITATLDLQPLIDADASANVAEDYPPGLLALYQHNGGLYGLPYIVTMRTLSYNRDMFEDAGLEPPGPEWTLEELVQAALQLSGGEGRERRYGYAALGPHSDDLQYFVARSGASLTTGSGETLAPNYTDPKVFGAVSLYLDLLRDASPHKRIEGYEANSSWGGDVFQLLSEGRLAMWFDRGSMRPYMVGRGGGQAPDIGIVAPPGLDTLQQGDLNAEMSLFISAQTEQPQACWEWLKYLSADISQVYYGFPARISAAESPAFAAQTAAGSAEVYRVYREAMERTPPGQLAPIRFLEAPPIEHYWFYRAVDRALQGGDLERELAEAQRLAEEHLVCVRAGGDLGECAIQVDPEYNGFMRPAEAAPAR